MCSTRVTASCSTSAAERIQPTTVEWRGDEAPRLQQPQPHPTMCALLLLFATGLSAVPQRRGRRFLAGILLQVDDDDDGGDYLGDDNNHIYPPQRLSCRGGKLL